MICTCFPKFIMLPVCFADAISLVYDENGNLVTGDGKYREYNSLNQLWKVYNGSDTSILLAEFTHHLVEERVLKKVSYNLDGSWKENVYYVDDNFVQVKNSSGTFNYTYIKHEGQIVAQEVNGIKTYIHPDHIGSATVVTNAAGATIENTTYTPYGEVISGGNETRYSYEGKEYDSDLEMIDFHFRKYRPDWGIFTQPDTLIQDVYDPQSLNRYMFERGNPYKHVDPDGHAITFFAAVSYIAIAALAGGVFGAGYEISRQMITEDKSFSELDLKKVKTTTMFGVGLGAITGTAGAALLMAGVSSGIATIASLSLGTILEVPLAGEDMETVTDKQIDSIPKILPPSLMCEANLQSQIQSFTTLMSQSSWYLGGSSGFGVDWGEVYNYAEQAASSGGTAGDVLGDIRDKFG